MNASDSLERTKGEFIYIIHDPEEEGKKRHIHLFLTYKNPVYWSSVLDRFEVSAQWCQKLEYRWETALLYLTHTNQPGKVQYSVDLLRGSDRLIQEACQAVRRYNYGHEFIADTVPVAVDWIYSQSGRYISPGEFVKTAIRLGFFKAANNGYVKQILSDHNRSVAASRGVDVSSETEMSLFYSSQTAFGDIRRFSSADLEGAVNE